VILVELGDGAFEAEFAACDLQALDEFAGAHEQHAPSVLDESKPDGCCEMALAGAGWAEQEQIGAVFEPAVAGGERHHLRLADHRDGREVEGRECLADWETRFGEMALDAATAALRHLVLGERGEEPLGAVALQMDGEITGEVVHALDEQARSPGQHENAGGHLQSHGRQGHCGRGAARIAAACRA